MGGPAGIGAAELIVDARRYRGEGYGGCNAAALAAPAGLGGLFLFAVTAVGLRRRE